MLTIPKENILEYEYSMAGEDESADANRVDANGVSEQRAKSEETGGQLYRTGNPKEKTIEKCVEEVGEAVVKVSSPAGMGSGFFINAEGYLITNYHVIEKETKIEVTVFQKAKDGFEKKKFKKLADKTRRV